jgi:hypothetical protein
MDFFACDECRSIHRAFQEALAAAKEPLSNSETTARDVIAWLQELGEDECARMREKSAIWQIFRRWQEHRAATGHYVSPLPVPPRGIGNPN